MSLLDKFNDLSDQHQKILSFGDDPFGVTMETVLSPTQAVIGGRPVILAGTNNYLGLTFDPQCVAAARDAIETLGTATTGSRFANGTYAIHKELEQALADFLGFERTIVFSTGYLANLGVISGLTGPDDTILIDAHCHACIYDGCRLSAATTIRFRHNSADDLDKRLSRLDDDGGGRLVIVEGLYSMFGDVAPLTEIAEVTRRHEAYLYVDEAHSFGVFGPGGRGVAEAQGMLDRVDFYVGTFSKSLSSMGGFCASSHAPFDLLGRTSRPYMFTASLSPSNVAAARAALASIESRPDSRQRLWRNAAQLYEGLSGLGYSLCAPCGPIIAVKLPSLEETVYSWNRLLEDGVYVNLAVPPGTPDSTCLLRLSVSAAHTDDEIGKICEAFVRLGTADRRVKAEKR